MADPSERQRAGWVYIGYMLVWNLFVYLLLGAIVVGIGASLAAGFGWPVVPVAIVLLLLVGLALYVRAYQKATLRESVMIHRSVEEVFRFTATDFFLNQARWGSSTPGRVVETEQTSAGPVGVGATGRQWIREQGREAIWTFTVTEYALNRAFALRATSQRAGRVESRYQFTPLAGGTKMTVWYEYRYGGPWQILMPAVTEHLRTQSRVNLARLQKLLEEGDYSTGSTRP